MSRQRAHTPARRRRRPEVARRAPVRQPVSQVLRASSPGDLLGVVPYLLGFHPKESLVLIAIRRRQVKLTARIDLPHGCGLDPYDAGLGQLRAAAGDIAPDAVVLLGYSRIEGRAEEGLDRALEVLSDLPVTQVLHADGQRWWSRSCDGPCCPPEGTRYDVGSSRTAAAAVAAGLSALPDREAVEKLVAGPAAAEHARLDRACELWAQQLAPRSLADRRAELHERLAAAAELTQHSEREGLDEATALHLAALCTDVMVRDVAWALMEPTDADRHLAVWQAVVDLTPPEWAPAPLCLLAVAAWVGGNGTLMVCGFERALQIDPAYSMALLLADMNTAAVPPALWPELQGSLRAELGLEPVR